MANLPLVGMLSLAPEVVYSGHPTLPYAIKKPSNIGYYKSSS
jgi:hypothetical protein